MKKLILYSDQIRGQSEKMDAELLRMLPMESPKIAYISSATDSSKVYFNQRVEYYKDLGITDVTYFDLDLEYDPVKVNEILSSDGIHLSGGDTESFLGLIEKRNFKEKLRQYVKNGGVLIGISAGSILMSESIDIAKVIHESEKEKCLGSALGFHTFEFVPHWGVNKIYLDEVKEYSREKPITIYACGDDSGIVVNDEALRLIGDVLRFENGIQVVE